jgi:hypothetical protein
LAVTIAATPGASGTLNIPANLTEIPASIFKAKTAITGVSFATPSALKTIGASAFEGCTGIISALTLPAGLESIGNKAFYGCNKISSLTFSEGLETIGDSAFYGCAGITTLSLPASLKTIDASAFYECNGLTWVKWPQSAQGAIINSGSTSTGPFRYCTSLVKVQIPDNQVTLGAGVFRNSYNVTMYVLEGTTPPAGASSSNTFDGSDGYLIYCPATTPEELEAYKTAATAVGWHTTFVNKLTSINDLTNTPDQW